MDKPIVIGLVLIFFIVMILCLAIEENRALQRELDAIKTENRRLWIVLNREKAPHDTAMSKEEQRKITSLKIAENGRKVK